MGLNFGFKFNGRKTISGIVMTCTYLLVCWLNQDTPDPAILTAVTAWTGIGAGHKVVKAVRNGR